MTRSAQQLLNRFLIIAMFVVCVFSTPPLASAQEKKAAPAKNEEWKPVEGAMNRSGDMQPDGALKFSMPRKDLKVSVAGTEVKAGLALGSWVAFKKMGNESMVMGDLVLTEDEVSPVMKTLEEGGVEITALHNHVLHESPRVMYMHIGAHGEAVKIAQTVRAALDKTKTPAAGSAAAGGESQNIGIDTKQIDSILGHAGKVKGGLYQMTVPRATAPKMNGMPIPNSMGVATSLNFQPTGGGKAAITGDFVLIGREVNPVIKALRDNGIEVTALHSHMLEEQPRLFFMHFWANDDAVKLAKGLRAALDKTDSKKAEAAAAPSKRGAVTMATAQGGRNVVFVCQHGAALSIISASYFNEIAQEEHLNIRAIARGITPQENLSPAAQRGLDRDGVAVDTKIPKRLSNAEAGSALRMVAFYPVPAEYSSLAPTETWDDVTWDTSGIQAPDYEQTRNRIVKHVEALITDLKTNAREL